MPASLCLSPQGEFVAPWPGAGTAAAALCASCQVLLLQSSGYGLCQLRRCTGEGLHLTLSLPLSCSPSLSRSASSSPSSALPCTLSCASFAARPGRRLRRPWRRPSCAAPRQTDMQRCAAFVKRLAAVALQADPGVGAAALVAARFLLTRHPRCRALLDPEPGGAPVGAGFVAVRAPFIPLSPSSLTAPGFSCEFLPVLGRMSLYLTVLYGFPA